MLRRVAFPSLNQIYHVDVQYFLHSYLYGMVSALVVTGFLHLSNDIVAIAAESTSL